MARTKRQSPGGYAYHVMNRCVSGLELFEDGEDYDAFERVLAQARLGHPAMRVCSYCLMPNHFHLVLWPSAAGVLSLFMQWLTMTHTQRWHAHRHSVGRGHLYQSRFKSFPIEQDSHFLAVCRYVERNALRAGLAKSPDGKQLRAEYWRWGSLAAREDPDRRDLLCDPWPINQPRNWIERVNLPQTQAELDAIRRCAIRGCPFGGETWSTSTAIAMGLESTTKPRGRPKKAD